MHARIIRNSKDGKDTFDICDTSLNGTYVNDYKISGSVTLKDGDLIAFGHRKGAILEQGAYAPQNDSEFLFKVIIVTDCYRENHDFWSPLLPD